MGRQCANGTRCSQTLFLYKTLTAGNIPAKLMDDYGRLKWCRIGAEALLAHSCPLDT